MGYKCDILFTYWGCGRFSLKVIINRVCGTFITFCEQLQHSLCIFSLNPRPSRGGGERRPGFHCMCMCYIPVNFTIKVSVKVQVKWYSCTERLHRTSTRIATCSLELALAYITVWVSLYQRQCDNLEAADLLHHQWYEGRNIWMTLGSGERELVCLRVCYQTKTAGVGSRQTWLSPFEDIVTLIQLL